MTKKERMKAAISGDKPDTIPYSLWSHMPGIDLVPELIAEKTYEFYKTYDVDFIKTMNNGMYSIEDFGCEVDFSEIERGGVAKITKTPIHNPEDWNAVKEVSIEEGALKREQVYLELLLKKVEGEDVPVIFTIFSPMTTANKMCGGKLLWYIENGYGNRIHEALSEITKTTCRLVERVIAMGASGIFFASQMSSYAVTTEEIFKEYGLYYDHQVINASKGWCNVLHAHGEDIMFSLLKDYPVQVFNWHVWQTLPTVEEACFYTGKCLMGGIERMDITNHKRNELREQIFKTIKATNGKHLILTPGCVIRYPLDEEMLIFVKELKEETERALSGK